MDQRLAMVVAPPGYRFARQQASTERAALAAGDYAVHSADGSIGAAERKSMGDLTGSLSDGSFVFELGRLATPYCAAVVVEEGYSKLMTYRHVPVGFMPDLLARVQVRYPEIPICFCENRAMAEEWTYRWLGAALIESMAEVR